MTKLFRWQFALKIILIPFLVFGTAAYFHLAKIDFLNIFLIFFTGFPFWYFFVLPIVSVFNLKTKKQIFFVIISCASSFVAMYLLTLWTPTAHSLIIGHIVYIENGIVNAIFYEELLASSLLFISTILIGAVFLFN